MFIPYLTDTLTRATPWRTQNSGERWAPIVPTSILYREFESRVFGAMVDSGAEVTLFQASLGERLGIPVRSGPSEIYQGFTGKDAELTYFHQVRLRVAGTTITTVVGFCYALPVNALLGRVGFFDHFKITFDPLRRGMQIDRAG